METARTSRDNCSNCRHWKPGFKTGDLSSYQRGTCTNEKVIAQYGNHGTHNHTPGCENWGSTRR